MNLPATRRRPLIRQDREGVIHLEQSASGVSRCGVDLTRLKKGFQSSGRGCSECFAPLARRRR